MIHVRRKRRMPHPGSVRRTLHPMTLPLLLVLLLALLVAATGCAERTATEAPVDLSLSVGLMPAVDAAPILLAEELGYFEELGLDVELQIFSNPQDRQSALQTQSIDGAITDLIAVAVNVDGGFDIKATTMTNGVFPVLAHPDAVDKTEIQVGMMEVSVTNFLIDEWLGDRYTIEKVYINDIPARLAAIGSGQLDMGLFPEPLASMGEKSGLVKTVYQPADAYCPDVLVFTGKALSEKDEAVALFHQAYDKAVEAIAADPDLARDILLSSIPNLDPSIRDAMLLPDYTRASLPENAYIEKVIEWTAATLGKDLAVTADDLVERKYTEK